MNIGREGISMRRHPLQKFKMQTTDDKGPTNMISEYVKLLADSVAQFREKIIVSILPVEIRADIEASKRYLIDNNACWLQDRLAPKHVIAEQFWLKGIHIGTLSAGWDLEQGSFEMRFSMRNFEALDTLPFCDRLDSVRLQHLKSFAEVKGVAPESTARSDTSIFHKCKVAGCNDRLYFVDGNFCAKHQTEYIRFRNKIPPYEIKVDETHIVQLFIVEKQKG